MNRRDVIKLVGTAAVVAATGAAIQGIGNHDLDHGRVLLLQVGPRGRMNYAVARIPDDYTDEQVIALVDYYWQAFDCNIVGCIYARDWDAFWDKHTPFMQRHGHELVRMGTEI